MDQEMISMIEHLWMIFRETLHTGGYVMWPICFISIIIWAIGIDRFFVIRKTKKYLSNANLSQFRPIKDTRNPFNLLAEYAAKRNLSAKEYTLLFKEVMIEIVPRLEYGFSPMSSLIKVAPLLGLLGTVLGMVQIFAVIMEFGIGNPQIMAEGISVALLTTQAGLLAAFPGMLLHNWLIDKKEHLIEHIKKEGVHYFKTGNNYAGQDD